MILLLCMILIYLQSIIITYSAQARPKYAMHKTSVHELNSTLYHPVSWILGTNGGDCRLPAWFSWMHNTLQATGS